MLHTLYASFKDSSLAEKATGALIDHGVKKEDISVISRDSAEITSEEFNRETPAYAGHGNLRITPQDNTEESGKHGLSTTTAGDAAAGAVKGAGVGLGLGIAAALAAVFIPGVGLVMGGGALALALAAGAGTTAAGAVAGGVMGFLVDQGMPNEAAVNYQNAYENGGALLAVNVPSGNADQATIEDILVKYQGGYINIYPNRYAVRV